MNRRYLFFVKVIDQCKNWEFSISKIVIVVSDWELEKARIVVILFLAVNFWGFFRENPKITLKY